MPTGVYLHIKNKLLNTGKTHFKKGFIPWNKGKKGLVVGWNKGLKGVCGRPKGIILSEEHKAKLRKPHNMSKEGIDKLTYLNQHPSKYKCKRISEGLMGHKHSQKTIEKISKSLTGFKHSAKSKLNMGLGHRGIKQSLETIEKRMSKTRGKNNWNWQGGITPLRELIRNSIQFKQWRSAIFKKDNYTCQECFVNGIYVEAHHIKPFSIIFNEFLAEYSQFSPIDDKETLLRLTTTYKPFWEVNNGITYCKECHKKINHYWLVPNMRNVNNILLGSKASD